MAWNTAYDLDSLMVNTKAATVYSAHENSLFLGGGMIPWFNYQQVQSQHKFQ